MYHVHYYYCMVAGKCVCPGLQQHKLMCSIGNEHKGTVSYTLIKEQHYLRCMLILLKWSYPDIKTLVDVTLSVYQTHGHE